MNEFIEQFLVECRELIDQATEDLLGLEEAPHDAERLASVFRGFHTLKGAAGIIDFHAMARALHIAEDMLSSARSGAIAVTPSLIGDSLTCLDQVGQWLDVMETTGDLPSDAEGQADVLIRRLTPAAAREPEPVTDWSAALRARHPEASDATLALRYAPAADSFFRGVDPLARLRALPGLRALEVHPVEAWPVLPELDPFRCNVRIEALLDGTLADVGSRLEDLQHEIILREIASSGAVAGLSDTAGALLRAQRAMLAIPTAEGIAGRIAAAGRVAASILRVSDRRADAERIEGAATRALSHADPQALIDGLDRLIDGESSASAVEGDALEAVAHEPTTRTLRVDVERVDALVNLAGELMVARTALAHAADRAQAGEDPKVLAELLKSQHLQLDRLVGDLQHAVMNIRVLPLRHVFQRFPRLAREMIVSLGKPARLITEGGGVEADKAIVESLFEPILHVLRNAFDHGIESAQERAAAGKHPSATVRLGARREGDYVIVEIEDDGRGLDLAKLRETAVRRGLVTEEAAAALSDAQAGELIFAPGFSTASEVTNLSGRGVGMDAVRTAIERMGGRVQLTSREGQGTTVRFVLPFTVVMSRVMTVEAGGQLFGIPLEAVLETVRIDRAAISPVADARAFVHRDRTIPLIDLAEALGERLQPGTGEAQVVIATAGGHLGGLEVDRLGVRMDVMLKPMDGLLSGTPGVAGTTLLGDGRVLLVLDLQELLQ